jgi:hypothetical protein
MSPAWYKPTIAGRKDMKQAFDCGGNFETEVQEQLLLR